MFGQTLEAAARAVIARKGEEWIALAPSGGKPVVVGRSRNAAPLVRMLKEKGYSVRFEFPWHRLHATSASNEPASAGRTAKTVGH